MNVLLTAINAKYIHSNLAVYSLKASAGVYEPQVELAEYTINHQADEIFAGIYRKRPELLLFSCYIWNRREVLEAADTIRKVLPDTKIWAGGPEVTYDGEQFLKENPQFDGVMEGEGEETFYRLLSYYIDKKGTLDEIPGIVWKDTADREFGGNGGRGTGFGCKVKKEWETAEMKSSVKQPTESGKVWKSGTEFEWRNHEKQIHGNLPVIPSRTLDQLPFVYRDLTGFENRIIYYESSRGCPFSCSYCLSSVDKRVRYRSLELVREELTYFLEKSVKQVKFVDRTFNCSHARTLELWRFLRDHDNGVTNFHCEISADLLNEEELELLGTMRPGLLQLEIGVQTVNPDALAAIHRSAPFEKIAANVRRISKYHNIHQHLDLIAGLPYEDLESFRTSFDTVYRLYPQELQLGFLKVLKGSEMYERAQEYGIVYRSEPPYEVLATRWIRCDELLWLKEIEEMLEIYYNSRQFRNTIRAAEVLFDRPAALYEALADYYRKNGLNGSAHSRLQRFEILRAFLQERASYMHGEKTMPEMKGCEYEGMDSTEENRYLDELLAVDLYLRENAKSRPEWAGDQAEDKEQMSAFYRREEQEHRYLPKLEGMSWKQMMRMTHLERVSQRTADFCMADDTEKTGASFDMANSAKEKRIQQKEVWLLFDYGNRDPLTSDAAVQAVHPVLQIAQGLPG